MCISKFFVLLGLNSSFGKRVLSCQCDQQISKKRVYKLMQYQEGKMFSQKEHYVCILEVRGQYLFSFIILCRTWWYVESDRMCFVEELTFLKCTFFFFTFLCVITMLRMQCCWPLFLKLMLTLKWVLRKLKVLFLMLYLTLKLSLTRQTMEKAMAPRSSALARKIPWMEEPGRLQSMGSLRVRHD